MAAYDISRGDRRIGPTTGLAADLARRLEETGRPIRVGLIGSGEMGTDIVTQCQQMTGITVAAIAEINIDCRAGRRCASPAAPRTAMPWPSTRSGLRRRTRGRQDRHHAGRAARLHVATTSTW